MKAAEKILSDQIRKHKTPGIQYYHFNQEKIIFNYAAGFADIENNIPVNETTTFNAYSMTKTFTALAVLQLVEKGLIGLDKPVKDYLPDFPYGENITVRQLLSHTSGIPNPIPLRWIHIEEDHAEHDYREYFKNIFRKHNKTRSGPNEKFFYSNLGYILLGMLIEVVSGQHYSDYIEQNIIKKSDIPSDQLAFTIPEKGFHAKGYQKSRSLTNLILGLMMDKSQFVDKREGRWISSRKFYVSGTPYGGLIGTGGGFVSYLQELLKPDNRLISDKYKQKLFTENITENGKSTGMCLGWFKGELNGFTYFTHAGGGGFYYCEIRLYPELGTGSVIMFNRTGMSDARFLDRVDRYFIGKE